MKKDALTIALNFLKYRPRSVLEIEQKLKTKKIPENEIKKVIVVLKKEKLLDDLEFAKMWVRDRNLLRPTGSFLLKLELKKFGISDEMVEIVLKNQDEEDLAKKTLESKSRLKNADYDKKVNFLKRRGFSHSIIFKILKK